MGAARHSRVLGPWLALLLSACSDGQVSYVNAGKAGFNEAKAVEKIYRAGYTSIHISGRGTNGAWRGYAFRRGSTEPIAVSVAEVGPVISDYVHR